MISINSLRRAKLRLGAQLNDLFHDSTSSLSAYHQELLEKSQMIIWPDRSIDPNHILPAYTKSPTWTYQPWFDGSSAYGFGKIY